MQAGAALPLGQLDAYRKALPIALQNSAGKLQAKAGTQCHSQSHGYAQAKLEKTRWGEALSTLPLSQGLPSPAPMVKAEPGRGNESSPFLCPCSPGQGESPAAGSPSHSALSTGGEGAKGRQGCPEARWQCSHRALLELCEGKTGPGEERGDSTAV